MNLKKVLEKVSNRNVIEVIRKLVYYKGLLPKQKESDVNYPLSPNASTILQLIRDNPNDCSYGYTRIDLIENGQYYTSIEYKTPNYTENDIVGGLNVQEVERAILDLVVATVYLQETDKEKPEKLERIRNELLQLK